MGRSVQKAVAAAQRFCAKRERTVQNTNAGGFSNPGSNGAAATTGGGTTSGTSTPPAGGTTTLLTANVTNCQVTYQPLGGSATARNGIVSLQLAITLSNETVSLYHEVHINNAP